MTITGTKKAVAGHRPKKISKSTASKTDKSTPKKEEKRTSFKNQIRSIRRLLNKPDLPADVRQAKEKQIQELEQRMEKAKTIEKRVAKFRLTKSVRFFERRKAERRVTKAAAALETAGDDRQACEARLEAARSDLNYIKYFPSDKKYLALFVDERNDPRAERKIAKIRAQIAERLAEQQRRRNEGEQVNSDEEGDFDAQDDFFLASDDSDENDL